MIHKILVATDGSEVARRAVGCAAQLAARLDVPLRIVCVMTDQAPSDALRSYAEIEHLTAPREPSDPAELPVAGYWSELRPGALGRDDDIDGLDLSLSRRFVDNALRMARDAGVHEVEGLVLAGDPADAILADAAAKGADMIVIGNRGHGALRSAILGSVSEKVVHHATCCVLVEH